MFFKYIFGILLIILFLNSKKCNHFPGLGGNVCAKLSKNVIILFAEMELYYLLGLPLRIFFFPNC